MIFSIISAIIYGVCFGVANIIPGLSGGTMLVIFGCYDKVCGALALNFKEIKKNFRFLVLFGIGAIVGILGFARLFTFLVEHFPVPTYLFLVGLVLGGLPLVVKLGTETNKVKPICILPLLAGLSLVVGLFIASNLDTIGAGQSGNVNMIMLAVYGAIAAVAMVIPGVSGSFMLVAFGVYDTVVGSLKTFDFSIIIPTGIGILIGLVLGSKLILFLLNRFRLMVYCVICGMVIGSALPLIYPIKDALGLNLATVIGIVCLFLGGAVSFFMGKTEDKTENIA